MKAQPAGFPGNRVHRFRNQSDARKNTGAICDPTATEELPDYRGYAGKIISGTYRVGDEIFVLPQAYKNHVTASKIFMMWKKL